MERHRRMATARTLAFTLWTLPSYKPDAMHLHIADALDGVRAGSINKLMIFAPPQHGKSELASVRFPALWLGTMPEDPVILTSYGADLALDKSRQVRAIVESEAYNSIFPDIRTNPYSRAVELWKLASPHKAFMKAAGVGGPITGYGARLGIVDDPFENWEQAQSQVIRDKVWEWWLGTFRTRIWEGGRIVLIMTRWHEDDLAGRLLKKQPKEWKVIRLPAISETQEERDVLNARMGLPEGLPDPVGRRPGQPLCPRRFSLASLLEIKEDVGSLVWSAEYQGSPMTPEGNRIKRAWFRIVDGVPLPGAGETVVRVRYWDKASTAGGGAFTAGVLMAVLKSKDKNPLNYYYYVEHVVRGQWSSHERNGVMRQTAELDRTRYGNAQIVIEQEPGSSGKDAVEADMSALDEFPTYADRVTGDKDVRLEPFAARAESGKVMLVRGPWIEAWLDELTTIPKSAYRDQADATAGAYNRLAQKRWRHIPFAHIGQQVKEVEQYEKSG